MVKSIDFNAIIIGSLAKVTRKAGVFYHLTWKEKGKTITRYIRLDEVKRVRIGIKTYQEAKKLLEQTATKNLKDIFKKRNAS